jgi:hypothetical protein
MKPRSEPFAPGILARTVRRGKPGEAAAARGIFS